MADENVIAPLAQMNVKACGSDPKDAIRKNEQVFMVRIYGEAAALKVKEGRNGDPYSYLIGEFRAVNNAGKRFSSEKLFLPGTLQEKIEAQLKSGDGKPVQFAFDIYSTPDDKSSVGYRYAASSKLKTQATDRLAAMETELAALDAPVPEPEPEPAPEAPKPTAPEAPKPAAPKRK